jgi:catechol 2,3-dioxygenase-like lactoylglutathione lyase family enzyme
MERTGTSRSCPSRATPTGSRAVHGRSPSGEASVQLVTRDATAPDDSVISVHVGAGVDEAYAEAERRGYEIVYPLAEEAWGVRRFFVRAPDGNVINMVSHSDE